jgi:hypothetical protein
VEAGLAWTIGARARRIARTPAPRPDARGASAGKRRRETFDFLGGAAIKKQLAEGAAKRRVGLLIPTGAPARQHSKILDAAGAEVGEVTSGGFSPCLQKNIAMGTHKQYRCCAALRKLTRGTRALPRSCRLCDHRAVQGGHAGEGRGARQGERRHRYQDALCARALLQGLKARRLFSIQ